MADSRKGKQIVRRRTEAKSMSDNSISLSITDALDFVYTYKQSEGVRQRTLDDYRKVTGFFMEWINEYKPEVELINDVTTAIIREYVLYPSYDRYNYQTKTYGLSPYTVNVRLRSLKSFFKVLHTEEIIDKSPTTGIKLLKVDEDTFQPLSEDEIKRLLNQPDVRYYAQFRDLVSMYLILDTGIRSSEMFDMKVADVDFKSRCISLLGATTKNRKPRILPLSNQVLKLLMELISEVKANLDTPYVFVTNYGEKYLSYSFRKRIHTYKESAGIEKQLSAHSLHHQFCRDYIMNGGDLFTLQRIAGHINITTTRKYIQFTTDNIKKKHAEFSPITRIRSKYRGG